MPDLAPEARAREQIDALLTQCGWVVQNHAKVDFSAGVGIALREVPLTGGRCDYLLLIDRKPVGVIEAKKVGMTLSTVADQSSYYGQNLPEFFKLDAPLAYYYESTGVETYFRDARDPHSRSRRVFAFHRPETLAEWLSKPNTLRGRLAALPKSFPLVTHGLRDCQIEAITQLEDSLAKDQPRSLIQMATGAGKTFTACSFAYRLIKHAGAKRILFLVDRGNLGRQTKGEFEAYKTPDTGRAFTELYNIQHMSSNKMDPVAKVTICTIQRLFSMLKGEELAEDLDERSGFELEAADGQAREVTYNPSLPIESFDFIVTDECHRSIYNLWTQVLEYFDAHLIGLTATPSKQTLGFFNQNLVTEYSHERAVVDGVNVGYQVYRIKTQVGEQGGKVEKGNYVDRRDKQTRARRWSMVEEDLEYQAPQLDRSVVVPDQIRTVLKEFKSALETELFPGRDLVPKTLIFAKTDSHAEDIVGICREVFGRGNDFCKKITYNSFSGEGGRSQKAEDLISEFRNSPTLRIAVTVDMIATGTDIKPLECLVFMRDVRSRIYFEQMKGRGTRTLSNTDLQGVSGADARSKDHFVIVDAVGVCESDKTDSRPLDREPTIKIKDLMHGVAMGRQDEDRLTTLASRLSRLDRVLEPEKKKELAALAGGKSLGQLAAALLAAYDKDAAAAKATGQRQADFDHVATDEIEKAQKALIKEACAPFDKPALRDALVAAKQETEQVIDRLTEDAILSAGTDAAGRERAAGLIRSFREYLETHKAEIGALQILYSRPYKQRLTEALLKELEQKLKAENAQWSEANLWRAYQVAQPKKVKASQQALRFADLVPLVRFALEQQPVLEPFRESVGQRFETWVQDKAAKGISFNTEQRAWLERIRDHVATSLSIDSDDFDYAPFSQVGGMGRAHQLFGDGLGTLLEELNEVLAA